MAVLAAVLLAAGVLRHYWDIATHRTVRGISFIFVGIDAAGDLFSLISIVFQPRLDILGMAIYGTELALWLGIFACGGYLNLRPWMKAIMNGRRHPPEEVDQCQTHIPNHESVAMHRMPSSTSVFHTPSSVLVARGCSNAEHVVELS